MDLFEYAHQHADEIVWMSQNTNQLCESPAIEAAILDSVKRREYNLYHPERGTRGLPEAMLHDLGAPAEYDAFMTNGAIEALYALNRALLGEGDEVICTDPSFKPIHNQIRLSRAKPIEINVYRPPWKLTPEWASEAITDKTRMLLLIDPLNPLGTPYTMDEVRALCEIAVDNDLIVVDDITYRDFSPNHVATFQYCPERTLLPYSFSKSAGLAGMRIGGLAGPKELIKKVMPYNTNVLSANIVAQRAALAALKSKDEFMPRVLEISRRNQEAIKAAVDKVPGSFIPVFPSATNMLVIDIGNTGRKPEDVQERLLVDHKVFVRAGSYVSDTVGNRFLRVSFTVPEEGAARFAEAFPKVMEGLAHH
ncbi:MAG: pyridoxal phosphate-dependent aminotransferase [Euryarchaeota archaeon]|nr:pyridoxal phosphate-dependent aminotransferase [Euryarchaeota archaeon]